MGTRGFIGVVIDGVTKGTYNHFDSYPSHLGAKTVADLTTRSPNVDFLEKARHWIGVDADSPPSAELQEQYGQYRNLVSTKSPTDWYCLLHRLQGHLVEHLQNVQHYPDNVEFLKDSLFCEWAYIWNLDEGMLEIYQGFQTSPPEGRYSSDEPNERGYYPVGLIATLPVDDNLPKNYLKWLEAHCLTEAAGNFVELKKEAQNSVREAAEVMRQRGLGSRQGLDV